MSVSRGWCVESVFKFSTFLSSLRCSLRLGRYFGGQSPPYKLFRGQFLIFAYCGLGFLFSRAGPNILLAGRLSDRPNVRFSRVSRIVPKQPYQNLRGFGVFLEVVAVEVPFSREL